MLWGTKRIQRITVGIVVGIVVVGLTLSLVGSALALPADPSAVPGAVSLAGDDPTATPASSDLVSTTEPKPVTKTPQGTSTQVTDSEHLGGLIGFIAFMLGGVLLLVRAKRRERRERAAELRAQTILSGP